MAEEIRQREECKCCLYVITPKMTGVFSIAEVVDDSRKRPAKTIFCVLPEDESAVFDEHQLKSLKQTQKMVGKNGAKVCESLDEVAAYLNSTSDGGPHREPLGMYGETPSVMVGRFRLSKNADNIWIDDTEGGDGGEFSVDLLEMALREFYDKNF
jgi:hypothetical protein